MHGQADYGMYTRKTTTYGLSDMGELAARLKSIVTFDRRGDIIWLDDFESDLSQWHIVKGHHLASAVLSALHSRSGAFSAKLSCSAVATGSISIHRFSPFPVLSKMGFEVSFTIDSDLKYITFLFTGSTGTAQVGCGIRYYHQTGILMYYNLFAGYTQFASGITLRSNDYFFHTAKLVGDMTTGKYVRFILDNVVYDMNAYQFYWFDFIQLPYLYSLVYIKPEGLTTPVSYVDDVIMTQNEP